MQSLFKSIIIAAGVALAGTAASAQATGPISAAEAKKENAPTYTSSNCVSTCKARGNGTAEDCAKTWCSPGQCYRSNRNTYCIK